MGMCMYSYQGCKNYVFYDKYTINLFIECLEWLRYTLHCIASLVLYYFIHTCGDFRIHVEDYWFVVCILQGMHLPMRTLTNLKQKQQFTTKCPHTPAGKTLMDSLNWRGWSHWVHFMFEKNVSRSSIKRVLSNERSFPAKKFSLISANAPSDMYVWSCIWLQMDLLPAADKELHVKSVENKSLSVSKEGKQSFPVSSLFRMYLRRFCCCWYCTAAPDFTNLPPLCETYNEKKIKSTQRQSFWFCK